ncbi:Txe/YoeB family addiction module toxin [Arthrobacter sp.]|uniref:Txe/YoeB family addiction module toxin n=1 Tax=Arthrobacter sp. TaxID=1667 RepID=UPI0033927A87
MDTSTSSPVFVFLPLKHGFHGYWSRRINAEHRLVYRLEADEIRIASCRYHYD